MSGIAAVVGIALTIFQVSSTRSRVHTIASQSMDLAKKLGDELDAPGLESRRGKALSLRAQLWERADTATQEYLVLTVRKRMHIIDAIASVFILILLWIITWQLKGLPPEWQLVRWIVGLVIPVLVTAYTVWQIRTSSRHNKVDELLTGPESLGDELPTGPGSLGDSATSPKTRALQYGLMAGMITAGVIIAGLIRDRKSN